MIGLCDNCALKYSDCKGDKSLEKTRCDYYKKPVVMNVKELAERVAELEMENRRYEWVPCSERLPEAPTFCLVTTDGSYNDVIDIALYMSDGWHKASKVIAWMPLPEPYKDGGAE